MIVHERASRWGRLGCVALAALTACGTEEPAESTGGTAGSSSGPSSEAPTSAGSEAPTSAGSEAPTSAGAETSTTAPETSTTAPETGEDSSTGPGACVKKVVLMGYWPPTNEMLRPWSTDPTQNPGGWIGEDWGGYGYDVYAFFPEFPPDGDPSNDEIGDPGAVGSPDFDLRVDYQATSADFWRIVDEHRPVILMTTSRGGEIGWEVEAVEGGHGGGGDPATDWASDKYGDEWLPTEATIEARSWDAISTYRLGETLPSQLPMDAIVEATAALGLTDVAIDPGTSGNFLSGFLGLHGLYYNAQNPFNVAAGHIHVGFGLPEEDASALIEASLHAVLQAHPSDEVECP